MTTKTDIEYFRSHIYVNRQNWNLVDFGFVHGEGQTVIQVIPLCPFELPSARRDVEIVRMLAFPSFR